MKNTIFKKEYHSLFTIYGHGVDTIQHILHSIGYEYKDLGRKATRIEGLKIIELLLKNDIIYVSYWGKYHNIVKYLDLNIRQTMLYIETVWFEGANYMDFEEMISFGYKDWYLKKTKEYGIDINTDWDWFANEFVVNLKQWIEENKPKT